MIRVKKSKAAMIVSGIYLGIAFAAFLTHIISVNTNPADSGLSAIWFYLCSLPWIQVLISVLPKDFTYTRTWGRIVYHIGWGCVFINALILYCLSGGIKLAKGEKEK